MSVILETTIPDAFVSRVVADFTGVLGKSIQVTVDTRSDGAFTIEPVEGEGQKAFGERVLKTLGFQFLKAIEYDASCTAQNEAIEAVPSAHEDVPPDILE